MKKLILLFLWSGVSLMADFVPSNRPYDVKHYKIALELNPADDPKVFKATVETTLNANSDLDTLVFDAEQLKVEKVVLKGKKAKRLTFEQDAKKNTLTVKLDKKLAKNEKAVLLTFYQGNIQSAHQGFFKVTDPDDAARGNLYFTHFEALGARMFFPCNDEPYDKATTEILVKTPIEYEVLSNGKIVGAHNFNRNNKPWYDVHWSLDKPQSTYLVALAVGKFKRTGDAKKKMTVWVGEQKAKQTQFALDATTKGMKFFERYLGVDYAWPQYIQVGIPTYLWGGMENTSATFMNQERILLTDPESTYDKKRIVSLVAHELAHQWFGDLVTMKWWDDVWLNEAFASYFGTLATRDFFKSNEPVIDVLLDTWDRYFREENGPRSHPLVNNALQSPEDAFDSINYVKGENILSTLSFYMGEENFKKGIKEYLTSFSYLNADYKDFFNTLSKAGKIDLSSFQNTWLLQKGYPVVSYQTSWDSDTSTVTLDLQQVSNHQDRSIYVFKMPVVFHRKSNSEYHKEGVVLFDKGSAKLEMKLPAEPEWVTLNPRGEILAKVIPASLETLAAQALNDPDEIARVWAFFTISQPLREGEKTDAIVEHTLIQGIEKDPSPYVRNSILSQLKKMKRKNLPEGLAKAVFQLAQNPNAIAADTVNREKQGWVQFRSELYGTLGKVNSPQILEFLKKTALQPQLSLDDLAQVSLSIAHQGNENSGEILKQALKVHEKRGYRYQYAIQIAYGAYENPLAVKYLKEMVKTAGIDYFGRVGWLIEDNTTLKGSELWPPFLQDFILKEDKFGEGVKVRLLQTLEEVKSSVAEGVLKSLVQKSPSQRVKDLSQKILDKNYGSNS